MTTSRARSPAHLAHLRRASAEADIVSLPGTDLRVPHGEVAAAGRGIAAACDASTTVVVYCRTGVRAAEAAAALRALPELAGTPVLVLRGGLHGYADEVDDGVVKY